MKRLLMFATTCTALLVSFAFSASAQQKKPNILIIWGDDIGYWNLSAYNQGMMGYKTPNIDRIAREGALFTDWYGQQSCTAGRAAFITGQSPIRTGLTKVGLPGAKEGLQKEDPTLADLLKPLGYATGQFGKNHLGDRNEFFPTVHGFDVFFGNLYHLNAEQEPEDPDYPKDPKFAAMFGPRGVFKCTATATENPAPPDPRFGAWGKQTCEDTGPLTIKRMETIDEEVTQGALDFMTKAHQDGKPFFVWWNSTRMHIWTHLKESSRGKTGLGVYPDGMVEHDAMVGQLLDKLKELGIDDNTIVMYSTDNGAETMSWPDGGTTVFRSEKNTNWEGGYRVPCAIRWPGVIKPGTIINDIGSHEDMIPTLMAAVGDTTVKEDLAKGAKFGDKTFKVHLDGYNLMPTLQGQSTWPRQRIPLLDRRRQRRGSSLQPVEGYFPGAKCPRATGLDAALHRSARSLDRKSAYRSLRTRRVRGHGLQPLVCGPRLRARSRGVLCSPVVAELPRVPAAAEAGHLQPRPRDGRNHPGRAKPQQLTKTRLRVITATERGCF